MSNASVWIRERGGYVRTDLEAEFDINHENSRVRFAGGPGRPTMNETLAGHDALIVSTLQNDGIAYRGSVYSSFPRKSEVGEVLGVVLVGGDKRRSTSDDFKVIQSID